MSRRVTRADVKRARDERRQAWRDAHLAPDQAALRSGLGSQAEDDYAPDVVEIMHRARHGRSDPEG